MNPLPRYCAGLVATCSLLYVSPVLADGYASSSFSNLRLGALDLTPDDGLAAGFSIAANTSPHLISYIYDGRTMLAEEELFPGIDQPGIARVDYDRAYVETHTSGTVGALGAQAHVPSDFSVRRSSNLYGSVNHEMWLTVLPNTLLTLTGHVTTLAEFDVKDSRKYQIDGYLTAVMADERYDQIVGYYHGSTAVTGSSLSNGRDDDFALVYANGSDQDIQVRFQFATYAKIETVAAIPEPQTWSMLGGGLLLLGLARRYQQLVRGGRYPSLSFDCAKRLPVHSSS